jgi:hypothetical protein
MFIYILCSVDYTTGEMSVGRFQLAKALGMKNSNTYKTLLRLKTLGIVTLQVTMGQHGFTTIGVVKWSIYQETVTQGSNTKVTLMEHKGNTKVTHLKNKEEEVKNKEFLTFKEKNKISEDREKRLGYLRGELKSLKEFQRTAEYVGRTAADYDEDIKRVQLELSKLQ